jgi:hypothetical protein
MAIESVADAAHPFVLCVEVKVSLSDSYIHEVGTTPDRVDANTSPTP